MDKQNFVQLVERAMADQHVSHMRAVVEKELLHYDILYALEQAGLLDSLVFQGGTSLRLCYDRTLGKSKFQEYLSNKLVTLFTEVRRALFSNGVDNEFRM